MYLYNSKHLVYKCVPSFNNFCFIFPFNHSLTILVFQNAMFFMDVFCINVLKEIYFYTGPRIQTLQRH